MTLLRVSAQIYDENPFAGLQRSSVSGKVALTLLGLFLFSRMSIFAQSGCTDPQALNFSSSASSNDGSCQYPVTNYSPSLQTYLPNDLAEISGMVLTDTRWWVHEDSGNDRLFYQISIQNGGILQEVKLKNANNRDWEDITTDGQNLYIGDFGNNNDDRENLGIYKVNLNDIGNGSSPTIDESEWQYIPFSYPDQTDFSTQPEDSTLFDCEAMIWWNNRLHLFTKKRKTYTTDHYAVDPNTWQTTWLESFNVNGLITGAAVSPDSQVVALVGYDIRNAPVVFTWLLWGWNDPQTDLLFSGHKRRIEMGSALITGQVESIAFKDARSGYISNETTTSGGVTFAVQAVRKFDFSNWITNVSSASPEVPTALDHGEIYPNPVQERLFFSEKIRENVEYAKIFDAQGRLVVHLSRLPATLETAQWPAGVYQILLQTRDGAKYENLLKTN